MQYLTYEEYKSWKKEDALPEEDYQDAELKARKKLDYITDSRISRMAEVPETVKAAMRALLKLEEKYGVDAQAEGKVLASFTTDGYSESYGGASDQIAEAEQNTMKTIKELLCDTTDDEGTYLLYRGVVN